MPEQQREDPAISDDFAEKIKARREAKKAEDLESPQLSDEELQDRASKRKKIAQLLTRGFVNDRLDPRKVLGDAYDPNRVYEWFRTTQQDIDRARAIGFRLEQAPKGETPEGTHGQGDDRIVLGDVCLMSIDRETYEIIQEVREEQRRKKRDAGKKDYVKRVRQAGTQAAPLVNPQNIEA